MADPLHREWCCWRKTFSFHAHSTGEHSLHLQKAATKQPHKSGSSSAKNNNSAGRHGRFINKFRQTWSSLPHGLRNRKPSLPRTSEPNAKLSSGSKIKCTTNGCDLLECTTYTSFVVNKVQKTKFKFESQSSRMLRRFKEDYKAEHPGAHDTWCELHLLWRRMERRRTGKYHKYRGIGAT